MPHIAVKNIPFITGTKVSFRPGFTLPHAAMMPFLGLDASGSGAGQLFSTPDWGGAWEQFKELPMDSLRVDVFGANKKDNYMIAEKIVVKLIQLLRWRTNQWWIGRSCDIFSRYVRNSFRITLDSASFDKRAAFAGGSFLIFGDERSVTRGLWNSVTEGITLNTEVPLHEVILSDAKYFIGADDIRRSVLDSAMGCEQAKNITFERLWHLHKAKKFRPGSVFKGKVNLPDHLDTVLEAHFGRSYKQEYPKNFDEIEQLWLARGNVAHGRREEYWWNGSKASVDGEKAKAFAQAAQHCARWLVSL